MNAAPMTCSGEITRSVHFEGGEAGEGQERQMVSRRARACTADSAMLSPRASGPRWAASKVAASAAFSLASALAISLRERRGGDRELEA